MAHRMARSKPSASCLKTHLARERSRLRLIRTPTVEQRASQVDIRTMAACQDTLDVVGYLYCTLTPGNTPLIQGVLIRLLLCMDRTLRPTVVEHGQRQLGITSDVHQPIDWTGLEPPAFICQAVWQFHCVEILLKEQRKNEKDDLLEEEKEDNVIVIDD